MSIYRITFTRKDCLGTEFSYYEQYDDTMTIDHITTLMAVYDRVKTYLQQQNLSIFDRIVSIEQVYAPHK